MRSFILASFTYTKSGLQKFIDISVWKCSDFEGCCCCWTATRYWVCHS